MEQPNLNYIKSMSGGDQAFEQKLLGIIKQEFPQEVEVYQMNMSLKEYGKAADNVHKLKHKISILGLQKSYAIAQDYEKNLLEGSTSLEADFSTIIHLIASFLETQ